jgi:tRNA(Ile2) C34 agmatinyltransferase TiaS
MYSPIAIDDDDAPHVHKCPDCGDTWDCEDCGFPEELRCEDCADAAQEQAMVEAEQAETEWLEKNAIFRASTRVI